MNDFFYFSSKDLELVDLRNAIVGIPMYTIFLTEKMDALQIELPSKKFHWQLFKMNIENDFGESDSLSAIRKYGAVSCFCVSHHSWTLTETAELFRAFMLQHDGWVGNDSDGFEPIFTLKNIEALSY